MTGSRLILLSEEEVFLQTATGMLAGLGFDVTPLSSAEAMLELLEDLDFDALVLDCDIQAGDADHLVEMLAREHPLMAIVALARSGVDLASVASVPDRVEVLVKPCEVREVGRVALAAITRLGRSPSRPRRPSIAPIRLLLVHDVTGEIEELSRVLTRRGMTVETATGGTEAADVLREGDFDVAVIDARHTDIGEQEILRGAGVPVTGTAVVILARSAPALLVPWQERYSFHGALARPCDIEDLVEAIREAGAAARAAADGGGGADPGSSDGRMS
jgi:DNA-binding NtrC family response regulator